MKRQMIYFLTMIFVISLSACASKEVANNAGEEQGSGIVEMMESSTSESVAEAPTEEPAEAPSEESTETSTPEPTETPASEPTETPTPEPTETPTPEPTETPTPEPTETLTPEPTETPTPEPTETSASEPIETPTPEPKPELVIDGVLATPATPPIYNYHGGDGSDIGFSGTVTLPYSNVTIPTLNQFQYYGLEIPIYSGYEQWNYENVENIDKDAYYAFYERIGATFDEYRRKIDLVFEANGVLEDQGSYQQRPEDTESHRVSFAYVSPVAVQWETGAKIFNNDIEILKYTSESKGYDFPAYTVIIRTPLKWTEESTAANNWSNIYTEDRMKAAYDALIFSLSYFTTTPVEVAEGIMDMLYGETLYTATDWYAFGDSLVNWSRADYVEDKYTFNFTENQH